MTFKQLTAAQKFPRWKGMRVAQGNRFGTIQGSAFGQFRVKFDGEDQASYCNKLRLDYMPDESKPEPPTAAEVCHELGRNYEQEFRATASFQPGPSIHADLAKLAGPAMLYVDGRLIGEVVTGQSYAAGLVALHRPRHNGSRLSNQLRNIDEEFEPTQAATVAPPVELLAPTLDGHLEALLEAFPKEEQHEPTTTTQEADATGVCANLLREPHAVDDSATDNGQRTTDQTQ